MGVSQEGVADLNCIHKFQEYFNVKLHFILHLIGHREVLCPANVFEEGMLGANTGVIEPDDDNFEGR